MTMKIEDGKLPDFYWSELPNQIDKSGFPNPPILGLQHDGTLIYGAVLDLDANRLFDVVHNKFISDIKIKEVVFAIDRMTKPSQGTKYDDVLSIFWWYGPHEYPGFRYGVVNYQIDPLIIEPIDWNNEFWTGAMTRETMSYIEHERARTARLVAALKRRGMLQ
jgi:hypothetical protein